MSESSAYASPAAFRQALTGRLKRLAQEGPWTFAQLQRQVAYDRLLARLYLTDDQWILKGATALLARDLGVRGSLDIDMFRNVAQQVAETELREAVSHDVKDWFRFELGGAAPMEGAGMTRIPVVAFIGASEWERFHVDLSGDELRMTGEPEDVPALARAALPDVAEHEYRVYPLVDHIADKIVATFQQYGRMRMPSTRYRDLVDLVAIVTGASVEAAGQITALTSESARRSVRLPARFDVPDRALWERGYAKEAERSFLPQARTLDEALGVVGPFIDPLLDGTAAGAWDHVRGAWVAAGSASSWKTPAATNPSRYAGSTASDFPAVARAPRPNNRRKTYFTCGSPTP